MSRPVSWLYRLHEVSRFVANSVRSHYDRRDLEALFELQPRAAQKLLELLPSVQVGTSRLVDREVLSRFLDRVRDADDTAALFDRLRTEKVAVSKRKIRSLVRRDLDEITLDSLPATISFTAGQVNIGFRTLEELAESLLLIARILESGGDVLAERFEPQMTSPILDEADEMAGLFAELRADEEARRVAVRQPCESEGPVVNGAEPLQQTSISDPIATR